MREHGIPGVTVVDPEVEWAERRAAGDLARARGRALGDNGAIFGLAGGLIDMARRASSSAHPDDIDGDHNIGSLGRVEMPGLGTVRQPAGILPATYEPPPTHEAAPVGEGGAAQTNDELWRDLPPPSIQDQVAGTEWDPWAGSPAGPAPKPNEISTPAGPAPGDPWAIEGGPWSTDPETPEARPK